MKFSKLHNNWEKKKKKKKAYLIPSVFALQCWIVPAVCFLLGGAQRFHLCWFLWSLFQSPSSLPLCLPCPFGSFCLALQTHLFHPPLTYLLILIRMGEGRMRLKPSCIFKKHYKMCRTNSCPTY